MRPDLFLPDVYSFPRKEINPGLLPFSTGAEKKTFHLGNLNFFINLHPSLKKDKPIVLWCNWQHV